MFNDKFGLTKAVLEGRKTMTRRIIPADVAKKLIIPGEPGFFPDVPCMGLYEHSRFKVGEVVAVAQAYKDTCWTSPVLMLKDKPGWGNKMFVYAGLMPHQLRITNVRVERLQDISDEDCLREGIYNWKDAPDCPPGHKDSKIECYGYDGSWDGHLTPITAFAALIDKVSGKGTWASNPWVFVYEFELVK